MCLGDVRAVSGPLCATHAAIVVCVLPKVLDHLGGGLGVELHDRGRHLVLVDRAALVGLRGGGAEKGFQSDDDLWVSWWHRQRQEAFWSRAMAVGGEVS